MKKVVMTLFLGVTLGFTPVLLADDDEHGEHGEKHNKELPKAGMTVTDATYLKECGSCHFPYQPDLLPSKSWENIMGSLDKHFGENAELAEDKQKAVLSYLTTHAAEHSTSWYAVKFMKSLKAGAIPAKISEVPYFVKEHREIPKKIGCRQC